MSDVINKYLEYRKGIIDKDNQESIAVKKAVFEESLKTCEDALIPDVDGYSLLSAIVLADTESVAKILEKIGKFQQADKVTLQLLKDAISANKDETLKLLRDNGINIDQPEFINTGRTQLAVYAGIADLEACMLLLKNGADISAVNTFSTQPKSIFQYAFENKLDNQEKDPIKINEFKKRKIRVINLLSIWAWSIGYKPELGSIDLKSIDLDIIKNLFIIGAKYKYHKLALQQSLGFENAFLNMDALLEKARNDKQFNFKEIYLAFKHCIDAGNTDSKLLSVFEKIKQTWLLHQQEESRLVLYTLFYMPHTVTSLPERLKEQALNQQVELEIKPIDNQQFKA
jgi:hypothetical protein